MRVTYKPWGKEEILFIGDKYMVKRLTMNFGCRCSLQYHEHKIETIYVLGGVLLIHDKLGNVVKMESGDFRTIVAGEIHRMEGGSDPQVVYLESSTPETDDTIRLDDDYGRS